MSESMYPLKGMHSLNTTRASSKLFNDLTCNWEVAGKGVNYLDAKQHVHAYSARLRCALSSPLTVRAATFGESKGILKKYMYTHGLGHARSVSPVD